MLFPLFKRFLPLLLSLFLVLVTLVTILEALFKALTAMFFQFILVKTLVATMIAIWYFLCTQNINHNVLNGEGEGAPNAPAVYGRCPRPQNAAGHRFSARCIGPCAHAVARRSTRR